MASITSTPEIDSERPAADVRAAVADDGNDSASRLHGRAAERSQFAVAQTAQSGSPRPSSGVRSSAVGEVKPPARSK